MQLAVVTDTDPAEGRGLGRQTLPPALVQSTATRAPSVNKDQRRPA